MAAVVTLTGVALASIGGYAFSRFRFVGRKATMLAILTTQMFPATMLLLPLYILIAKLGLVNTYLGLMVFYTSTALPVLRLADERLLRHDSRVARRSGPHRRLQPRRGVLARDPAAGRAGPGDHRAVQLHDRLERIHRRRPGDAGRRNVHAPLGPQKLPGQHVDPMGPVRRRLDPGEHSRSSWYS